MFHLFSFKSGFAQAVRVEHVLATMCSSSDVSTQSIKPGKLPHTGRICIIVRGPNTPVYFTRYIFLSELH